MHEDDGTLGLFLCGDVMTGRGIDQILPHPAPPELHEDYIKDARDYVALAERRNGPVPRGVAFDYVWGEALEVLERERPAARIANLETSVTLSGDWEAKGINYRMSPDNVGVLTAAGLDVCGLANNHVLDWGEAGLRDTLRTLDAAGLRIAGAGEDVAAAGAPAIAPLPGGGRLLVFACGLGSSGLPRGWAAAGDKPGVNRLPDLSAATLREVGAAIAAQRRPGDLVVVSLHWGGNWGYEVPDEQRLFARGLIDSASADLVHGHSCHHFKGLEIYRGKLILYGCGDFINDYEGITGEERFRPDLVLMYLPRLRVADGTLAACRLVPLRLRKLRLRAADAEERAWVAERLRRESARFGTTVGPDAAGDLRVRVD